MKSIYRTRRAVLLVALSVFTPAAACRRTVPEPKPRPAATQYIVAVDLSTSQDSTDRATYKALLHEFAEKLDFGDRLVLFKAHAAGLQDTSIVRPLSIARLHGSKPLPKETATRNLTRETASGRVTSLLKNGQIRGTDLLATLHTAGELAEAPNDSTRTVLVLLSDMLQCAQGVCMEPPQADVPDSAWIEQRRQQDRLPSLRGMCVVVVGADEFAEEGVRVREFWRRYFAAAGANFDAKRYVHRASSAEMLTCEN